MRKKGQAMTFVTVVLDVGYRMVSGKALAAGCAGIPAPLTSSTRTPLTRTGYLTHGGLMQAGTEFNLFVVPALAGMSLTIPPKGGTTNCEHVVSKYPPGSDASCFDAAG